MGFVVVVLIIQSLIDRSLKRFIEIEYEPEIKKLESRLQKLEKTNQE